MQDENPQRESVAPGRALITIKEAEKILSMGKTKIYDLSDKGEILMLREPHMSRIDVPSLDEYLGRLRKSAISRNRPDNPGRPNDA